MFNVQKWLMLIANKLSKKIIFTKIIRINSCNQDKLHDVIYFFLRWLFQIVNTF